MQIDFGFLIGVSENILSKIYTVSSLIPGTDLTSGILKFNPNSFNSIANIFAGGSLTLDKGITERSLGFQSDLKDSIIFPQELEIPPGQGVCVVHEAEISALIYNPYVSYYWFE